LEREVAMNNGVPLTVSDNEVSHVKWRLWNLRMWPTSLRVTISLVGSPGQSGDRISMATGDPRKTGD
jgi:hypothetical protein